MKNILFLLLFGIAVQATAQSKFYSISSERGETKGIAELEAKAKSGNLKAMLELSHKFMGDRFTPAADKDYKSAEKWLDKIAKHKDAKPGFSGEFEKFKIYITGGYGAGQNTEAARNYLRTTLRKGDAEKNFPAMPDLNMKDFFQIVYDASNSRSAAQLEAARFYYEFDISYAIALTWLKKAEKNNNPDAPFLRELWALEAEEYSGLSESEARKRKESIVKKYLDKKSPLAVMMYVSLAGANPEAFPDMTLTRAQKMLEQFLFGLDESLKAKAVVLLLPFQEGRKRWIGLRKLLNGKDTIPLPSSAKLMLEEGEQMDLQIKSLVGLAEFISGKKNEEVLLDFVNSDYERDPYAMVEFFREIQKRANRSFIGEKNFERYAEQILEASLQYMRKAKRFDKISRLYDALRDKRNNGLFEKGRGKKFDKEASDVIVSQIRSTNSYLDVKLISECFKRNRDLQKLFPSYSSKLKGKMGRTPVNESQKPYYDLKAEIMAENFDAFARGKTFFYKVEKSGLSEIRKNDLKKTLRKELINDLYGDAPKSGAVKELKTKVMSESWLQPDGMDIYFRYTENSPTWFSEKVYPKDTSKIYRYEVVRMSPTSYSLNVYRVQGGASNLALSTDIRVRRSDRNTFKVRIYEGRKESYKRVVDEESYLGVVSKRNQKTLEFAPNQNFKRFSDSRFSYPASLVSEKNQNEEFSVQQAIKVAVRRMILLYPKTFDNYVKRR